MSLFLTDQVALIWGVAAYPLLTISSERAGGSGEEHPMSDFLILPEETSEPVPGPRYRLIGQKPPLKPKEVWAIRTRLQIQGKRRDLALFNLAIDSKLRSCDLVALRVSDVAVGGSIRERAVIVQQKTGRPVQFELTEQTRDSVQTWIKLRSLEANGYLFPSRLHRYPHLSTRQYARIVNDWVASIGLDPRKYGTHSLRRTKAAQIYRDTGNLRAVQLLLGHTKLESTVRYLGIEVDDALRISEQTDL
jgi:integrase